jgi:hypothetical protein
MEMQRRTQKSDLSNYSRKPGLTATRLRPLARRREITARPLLVFIRERNPCVFDRRRRLGWNVRFGIRNCAPHKQKLDRANEKYTVPAALLANGASSPTHPHRVLRKACKCHLHITLLAHAPHTFGALNQAICNLHHARSNKKFFLPVTFTKSITRDASDRF